MKKFLLQLLPVVLSIFSGTMMAQTQARATHEANLSFTDRVAYQYAIEEVYWRHRIWPSENARAKPPLDGVMSLTQVQQKVETYLRNSRLLVEQGKQPITPEQLQGEMERMARDTKQPEVLDELFSALGNDPAIIAECLARQVLTERLVRGLSRRDERSVEQSVQGEEIAYPIAPELKKITVHKFKKGGVPEVLDEVSGGYTLPRIAGSSSTCADDSWTATSMTNAPTIRLSHTAVWTGTEMIVWGGFQKKFKIKLNTGSRYNPSTDSWVATTTTDAPVARDGHTAIWTGTEMIVWGGAGGFYESTGGRYNPGTDSWVAMTNTDPPTGRAAHTVVWTGSEMIVWGGFYLDINGLHHLRTGGRYNPITDSWVGTSNTNSPVERQLHTAVWTGNEMIVWGGFSDAFYRNTGGRYDPITNSWVATPTANSPTGRATHTAVWTGSEMIVWGGTDANTQLNTGGRYNPSTNSWLATTITNAPDVRSSHTAVWTGTQMIAWGGGSNGSLNTGGKYDPSTDSWVATTTTDAPVARQIHTAIWTGSEMIVWGGGNAGGDLNSGGRYCAPPGTFANISTRLPVETGNNVLIGGFIVTGTQPKRVIVRAIGPSLPFPGALADPFLELRDASGALLQSNDNWRSDQEAEIIATTIPPGNDLESALVATLPANAAAYTATVSGVNNGTGIGVVEVYDLNQAVDSKLANISTRGLVQTGDDVLIGGLIVLGPNPVRVIARAIGPSLGVPGALADPTLELRDGNGGLMASNDNWRSAQEAEIIATTLAPSNDLESAIVRSLPPGNYTGIVRGVNNSTGVGLVEAYNLTN